MKNTELLPLNLQFFAEESDVEDDKQPEEQTPAEAENTDKDEQSGQQKPESRTIPYDRFKEVNDGLKAWKSLGYESPDELKNALEELQALKEAEEQRKREQMTEQERLQAERDELAARAAEAEEKAQKALEAANQRLIKTEFRLKAREAGVLAEALDDAFVLADLSGVTVNDSGDVDSEALASAIESLLKAKPYLADTQTQPRQIGGPTNPAKDKSGQKTKEQLLKEAAERAQRTGRIEDRVAYSKLKRELEG